MTATIPGADTIDSRRLRQLREADPDIRILDVRTGGEFESVRQVRCDIAGVIEDLNRTAA